MDELVAPMRIPTRTDRHPRDSFSEEAERQQTQFRPQGKDQPTQFRHTYRYDKDTAATMRAEAVVREGTQEVAPFGFC